MERLKRRVEVAERALATLAELVTIDQPSPVERDAAIQRFEIASRLRIPAPNVKLHGFPSAAKRPPLLALPFRGRLHNP